MEVVVGATVEVLRVLSGQNVVVKVIVVVVPPVVQIDVPVDVTVREAELVVVADEVVEREELVVEVDVLEAVELVDDDTGVQSGRVNDSPQFPEPHSTMQFLAQAASPLVLLVSQHSAD